MLMDFIFGLIFIPKDQNSFRIYDPYFHHSLKPNVNTQTTWDNQNYYSFYTNSLGLRDSICRYVPPKTDKYRFLFIGDSHTEGVGVEYQKTFSGYFTRSLKKGRYDVLNAGVVSYSPKLYYLKVKYLLEEVHLKMNHLIVFIDISDIQNELAYEEFEPSDQTSLNIHLTQLWKWMKKHSIISYSLDIYITEREKDQFYELVDKQERNPKTDIYSGFFSDFRDTQYLRDQAFHNIGLWYLDKNLFDKWGRKGLELEENYMQKLVDLCKSNHFHISISVHPWPIQIKYGDLNNLQVNFWSEFAAKNQIGFINHFDYFMNQPDKDETILKYYQSGDVHWNEKGHFVAAEHIIEHLEAYYRKQ